LFKFKETFTEFWLRYCSTFDLPLSFIMEAETIPKKAQNYLLRVKSEGILKIKDVQEVNNSIVVSYQDRKKKKTKQRKETTTNKEIDIIDEETTTTTDTFRREKKKIVEVNFTSAITIATVNRIQAAAEFKELLMRDYLYYNNGGDEDHETLLDGTQRKRFKEQLNHLLITRHIREEIQELTNQLLRNIQDITNQELIEINRKLDTFNKVINNAKKVDMQSIEFLCKMSEDDFSTQKALNGAIINEQTMINNGQISVKGEKKKELNHEDLADDLKAIASGVFDSQVDLIVDHQDNEEENNNIIEGVLLED